MKIRAVTGAFRFVTGSGPKEGYKIETPVGTIKRRLHVARKRLARQLETAAAV